MRNPSPRFSAVVLVSLAGLLAPSSGHAVDEPTFLIQRRDGERLSAEILGITPTFGLELAKGTIPGDDWLTLEQVNVRIPCPPARDVLVLLNGDLLTFRRESLALAGDRLTFHCPAVSERRHLQVPLSAVALVWRALPDSVDDCDAWRRRMLTARRRDDVVVLRNGDTLSGVLLELSASNVTIEAMKRKVTVSLNQVAVLAPSTDLQAPPEARRLPMRAILRDGSRISLRQPRLQHGNLQGTGPAAGSLSIDWRNVVRLDQDSPHSICLSELKPRSVEHRPFLGATWPLASNGCSAGGPIRLGGNCFDRGLGVHAGTRACYALPEGYRFFESTVGLNDRAGRKGSVRPRLLRDDQYVDLGLKEDLRHGKSLPIRVNIEKAKSLTLIVDFGNNGDVDAHVDWADARLVR